MELTADWSYLICIAVKLLPLNNIKICWQESKENKKYVKNEPMIDAVSKLTLQWTEHREKEDRDCGGFSKSDILRGHWGGPPPLLQGDFFRPQGDRGVGDQAPLCLVWTARLEKCLALEALYTHERTHWKDIRLRWEEDATGHEKRKAGTLW